MKDKKKFLLPFLAAIGMSDAGYLTWHHFFRGDEPVTCAFGGTCDIVLQSSFSEIFGIPVALFGILFYFSVFALSLYWILEHKKAIHIVMIITTLGFAASLYLVYLMWYVIGAWCQYCLLSATTSTLLFLTSLYFFRLRKNE